jgi:nicotinamide-nucleotide amidase
MELEEQSKQVGQALLEHKLMLATAESCTGGWVAQAVTQIPGSSQWFERGFVTYTNEAKQEMLGVSGETLQSHGAVSEQTVKEMAEGALKNSRAQISLAISGVAGPTGGTAEKPVGMVCFAWAAEVFPTQTSTQYFQGDRTQVRYQSVQYALQGLCELIKST